MNRLTSVPLHSANLRARARARGPIADTLDQTLLAGTATPDATWIAGSDAFIMLADAVVFAAAVRLLTAAAPVLDGAIVRTYLLLCLSAALSLGAEVITVLQPRLGLVSPAQLARWLGAGAWAALSGAAVLQAWILRALARSSAPDR